MDTIITINLSPISVNSPKAVRRGAESENGSPAYRLDVYQMTDYQLIRILIREPVWVPDPGKCRTGRRRRFGADLRRRLWERRQKREREELAERLREELAPALDGYGENALVYEDSVAEESWVRHLLPLPEFDGYFRREWAERLLSRAVHPHFVVLGNADCLQGLLCALAPRMKSVLWIAPDLSYQDQLEEFAEEFFLEYGLAVNLHFLPENGTYAQMRIPDDRYREPVNVLDFTEGRYIPCFAPPGGSVWLDMASVREKERRIEARRLKVCYDSLRKRWRSPAAESAQSCGRPTQPGGEPHLDTVE